MCRSPQQPERRRVYRRCHGHWWCWVLSREYVWLRATHDEIAFFPWSASSDKQRQVRSSQNLIPAGTRSSFVPRAVREHDGSAVHRRTHEVGQVSHGGEVGVEARGRYAAGAVARR